MPEAIQAIPIAEINSSPYQARKYFDEQKLTELAESLKEEGLLQPISVRRTDQGYELIAGERRLRAAKILGWNEIEARVFQDKSAQDSAIMGLIENLQREDLNPIEEAEGYSKLREMDLTQEEIARKTGKGRTYINQTLRLLDLPKDIIENVTRGTISRSHAEELLRLSTPELQLRVAKKIPGHLTVEETRKVVDFLMGSSSKIKNRRRKGDKGVPDPLNSLWNSLILDSSIAVPGTWSVKSSGTNKWAFEISIDKENPKEVLADWFLKMGKSINKEHQEESPLKPDIDITAATSHENKPEGISNPIVDDEMQKILDEQLNKGSLL